MYAVWYQLKGEYAKAFKCLKSTVDDLEPNDTRRVLLYLNLGDLYVDQNEMDSAAFYYHLLESSLTDPNVKAETKASAYGALSYFSELIGDNATALQYLKEFEKNASAILANREQKSIYRIQQQYDYENLQNEMSKKIISRHRIIIIISALLSAAAIVIMVLQHKQKRLKEAETEMKSQIDAMKQGMRQTVKTSVLDHEISSRLRLILTAHDKVQKVNDPQKEWSSLVGQIMNGEEDPFEAARIVLETAYPRLYSTIKEDYPELTDTEAKICLLSCSDLSNTEMAEFLGLKTSTVNQNRSNLRKKLNLNSDKLKDQLRDELS